MRCFQLYLKALEIQGFKSFHDKTVLTFGEDITAIVGPNGTGKSNISDAIRWVMGEQSTQAPQGPRILPDGYRPVEGLFYGIFLGWGREINCKARRFLL